MEAKRELFEELYSEYGVGVKRFIFTQARRDADATDDIFQNTWENVFRYLHTLRERGTAKSWLYSIAKNEATRYYSHRDKRAPKEFASIDAEEAPDLIDEGADTFPDALADADRLAGLLGRLTEPEQQLMLLRYSYDMSLAEIAGLVGVNYNTVKSVTRRATIKLRKFAEAFGDTE
ncbi:MAG: sigma-70 family RNA polymerase sigma factor [Clostridiales Family XIII bacterium]|jgi:RNA polymerase sigma factor (sigma-70 family)|nr:sigma-70 family RNA polymerase sigma factor [Clostridiales Family XIII bacterium]